MTEYAHDGGDYGDGDYGDGWGDDGPGYDDGDYGANGYDHGDDFEGIRLPAGVTPEHVEEMVDERVQRMLGESDLTPAEARQMMAEQEEAEAQHEAELQRRELVAMREQDFTSLQQRLPAMGEPEVAYAVVERAYDNLRTLVPDEETLEMLVSSPAFVDVLERTFADMVTGGEIVEDDQDRLIAQEKEKQSVWDRGRGVEGINRSSWS